METYERACWCYHIYKDVLKAAVGKELACERESNNPKDCYAVFAYNYYSRTGNLHVINFHGPSLTANIHKNKVFYSYMYV